MHCEIYSPDYNALFEVTWCKQIITSCFPIAAPFSFFFELIFFKTSPPSIIHDFIDDLLTRYPKIGEKEAASAFYGQSGLCRKLRKAHIFDSL